MKALSILSFIFLIPFILNAQFEISYDPLTNIMSVEYTGCEPCLFVDNNDALYCEAHYECISNCTNEEYEDCYYDCLQVEGTVEKEFCLKECANTYGYDSWEDYQSCFDDCDQYDNYDGFQNQIIGYQYRLIAAWDEIPFNPQLNQSNQEEVISPAIQDDWVNIPDWHLPFPWPEVYSGHNTCYGIGIRIYYETALGFPVFCDFTVWECNIIG